MEWQQKVMESEDNFQKNKGSFMILPGACIFDMDELLLDSLPQWRAAIDNLLQQMGTVWTPELAALYQGLNAQGVARLLHRELRPAISVDECVRILRAELLHRFAADELKPMPGAIECVRNLSARFPCAVASGSPQECIETAMKSLGIAACFGAVLSSESVARGKPHPDVFLAAAAALNVLPSRCVVFEDSLAGVQAARAAKMKVIAIPSGLHTQEIERIADRVFPSLAEVGIEQLKLFQSVEN